MVDSEEPNSMFVFLFDDGSGEKGGVGYVGVDVCNGYLIVYTASSSFVTPAGLCVCQVDASTPTTVVSFFRKCLIYCTSFTGVV